MHQVVEFIIYAANCKHIKERRESFAAVGNEISCLLTSSGVFGSCEAGACFAE